MRTRSCLLALALTLAASTPALAQQAAPPPPPAPPPPAAQPAPAPPPPAAPPAAQPPPAPPPAAAPQPVAPPPMAAPQPAAGPLAPAAPTGPITEDMEPPATLRYKLGLVGLGVGGVLFLTGIGTGLSALDRSADLAARCPTRTNCPKDQQPVIDAMHTYAAASTATLVVGGLLTAGGAVAFFTSARGRWRGKAAASAFVAPTIGGASLGLRGEF